METAFEKVARLLLLEPKKQWTGVEISARTKFSRAMISRVVGQLAKEAVVARPYKNRLILVEPIRLLVLWSCRRTMPMPVYVKSSKSETEIVRTVGRLKDVALTGFRGAWLRAQYMRTTSFELYASSRNVRPVIKALGRTSRSPQRIAIYPVDDVDVFLGLERVKGQPVVSIPQNFVDLMSMGGSGPRVALHLGRATGLLEE